MSGVRVSDAASAQLAARRDLEVQYGANRIERVVFTRAWYATGGARDFWEVEGEITARTGLFGKAMRHFKFQIDPFGNVIGSEG